jgi:2-C-methyl-D-erythritol 2,4-cyclodiphosphate synthase
LRDSRNKLALTAALSRWRLRDHANEGSLAPAGEGEKRIAMPHPCFLVGHGYDLHRLQSGGALWLGGVLVSEELSPIAHSDGDVAIHALVDAILGALALGDIGEHFPDSDPQWKSAPSSTFLDHVMTLVRRRGYEVANADITILAERPRLKPFKPQMVARLRESLGAAAQVNIKAGTNEKCDAIGQGQAIAAHAVVLLSRVENA